MPKRGFLPNFRGVFRAFSRCFRQFERFRLERFFPFFDDFSVVFRVFRVKIPLFRLPGKAAFRSAVFLLGEITIWGRREGDYLLKNRNLPLCRLFCHFSYRKPPFSPAKLAIFIFKSSLFLSFFLTDGSTGKRLLTICNLSFRPEIPPLLFLHKACFREEHTKNMLKGKRIMLGEKIFFPSRAGRM